MLAKKVADNGGKVSVTEHFGFVTFAHLVGPFDSTGGQGASASPYPPEKAKDATGILTGKGGAELKWQPFHTDREVRHVRPEQATRQAQGRLRLRAGGDCRGEGHAVRNPRDQPDRSEDLPKTAKMLFERDEYHHGAPFDAMVGKGTLKKGENVIVLKVCQNDQKEVVRPGVAIPDARVRRDRRPASAQAEDHSERQPEAHPARLHSRREGEEMTRSVLALSLTLALALTLRAADWTQFKGPNASGVSPETKLPVEWSKDKGIAWTAKLPARGVSSPVVVGDRVYVTCSSGVRDDRLHVLCFDAKTGKQLWHRQLQGTGPTAAHPKSCMAAPTPVAD